MNTRLPKNLIIIYLCISIAAMGIGLLVPLIPILLQKSKATPSLIGLTSTVMSISILIFSLPVGKLIDKYGGKPIIAGGLIIYGISMLFFPTAHEIGSFMFWRFIEGAGAAAIWVGTESQINFISRPENRTKLLGMYATFAGLGFGTGPIIGGLFLQMNNSTMGFYWTFGIIMIAFIALIVFLENNIVKDESRLYGVKTNQKENIGERYIIRLIVISLFGAVLYGWMEASIASLLTVYLQQLHISPFGIGFSLFVFVLGGIIIPPFTGFLADRYGKIKVVIFFSIILAITTFIIPFQKSLFYIYPFAFLTGAAGISIYITSLSSLGDKIREDKLGTANGYFAICYSIGGIIGPFMAGSGFELIGRGFLFWQISGLAIFYCIFIWNSRNKRKGI